MQSNVTFSIPQLATEVVHFDSSMPASAGLTIAFAGRLDERRTLASKLGIQGPLPSDIELLAFAYQRWDMEMTEHLLGDFSFVLQDRIKQRIFGARDALGTCSLFYALKGTKLLACVRLSPLVDHPLVERRLNHSRLAHSVVPLSVNNNETCYQDILSLPGGSAFCLDQQGFRSWSYWAPDSTARLSIPDRDVPEALRALLFSAVDARLPKDSTPAALLSGGLDSSALVAVAAAILKQQNRRLLTISAVLPAHLRGKLVDEASYIRAFSDVENIDFLDITEEQRGPFDHIEKTLYERGPLSFSSRHYQYAAFSEAALAHGAHTILDGACGELGPSHYGNGFYAELFRTGQLFFLAKELQARAKAYRLPLSGVIKSELIKPLAPAWLLRLAGRVQRFDVEQSYTNQPFRQSYLAHYLQQSQEQMLAQANQLVQDHRNPRAAHARNIAFIQKNQKQWGSLYGAQYQYPFLDKRVIEFCLAAPTHLKVRNGYTRSLIRSALDGLLPPAIQWRTSKEPFAPDFHLRYNRQRRHAEQLFASMSAHDPVREVLDIPRLQLMAGYEMQANRSNTAKDFIAMHMVPKAVYLTYFLRQFPEFSVN